MTHILTSAQKVVAALLVTASFAMLFFPWIGLEAEDSIKDYYEEYAEENDMSVREARKEILSEQEDLYDKYRDEDTNLTGKDYVRMIKAEEDGAISPDELGFEVHVKYQMAKAWRDRYDEDSSSESAKNARDLSDRLSTARVVLWGMMILTGLAFVIALWTILEGKRGGAIFNAAVWAILCVLALVLVDKMNDPDFQEKLGKYGQNFVYVTEEEPYHILYWPFVGAALAVLACVTTYLSFGGGKKPAMPDAFRTVAFVGTPGWKCAACGKMCGSGDAFCPACGTRKPGPRACPGCGATVPAGNAFCGKCGTRV